ncbi:MAG: GNAT family N-acetyltransferase, partial [Chloroflexota bacterium]|nr:GNAT family N-acetyltransferase [Chloroflexota bacterium]
MSVPIREFRREDAAAVARMFQASDRMWPDGFDDGLRFPDEALLRDIEESKALGTYIAWVGEDAVGFADLFKTSEEKVGYLGLLNSDPAYHGRGVGRDLIRRVINKCVELGYKRLDLDTWPGNTRAVPLYKKTGFGWGPEAHELQNHMPLLLSHPLTKPYFEQVDWYEHLRRELRLGNDAERRNGALIFTYSWESEAGSLRAVFDQKTKALSELDTPELYLSLEAEQFEMLQGQEQTVRLHVRNKRERSLTLAVSASGGDPVSTDTHRVAQVGANGSAVVELKATAADDKAGEGAVKLNLVVDGAEVEMAVTVKARALLELELEPTALPLCPGWTVQAYVNVRSRLPERAKVELLAATSVGLEITLSEQAFELSPGEVRGIPVDLRATTSGQHSLALSPVVVRGEKREALPPLKVELAAAGPGEVVVLRQEKETTLLTQDVTLKVPHKGTGATLRDRESDQVLVNLSLGVGPPFWPSKLEEQEFRVTVETPPGSATLVV